MGDLRDPESSDHLNTPAESWPDWTDEYRWELGPEPSEADAQWAAEQLNDDEPMPDDAIDRLAGEVEAQDRIENGHLL
jgi:hypothetical protein